MILAGLFSAVIHCTLGSVTTACTCILGPPLTTERAVAEAAAHFNAIFMGTVVDLEFGIDSSSKTEDGRPFRLREVRATVAVHQRWKGALADTVVVHTLLGGEACGVGFSERGRYLVFATRAEAIGLATSRCTPTVSWGPDAERLARLLGPPRSIR